MKMFSKCVKYQISHCIVLTVGRKRTFLLCVAECKYIYMEILNTLYNTDSCLHTGVFTSGVFSFCVVRERDQELSKVDFWIMGATMAKQKQKKKKTAVHYLAQKRLKKKWSISIWEVVILCFWKYSILSHEKGETGSLPVTGMQDGKHWSILV